VLDEAFEVHMGFWIFMLIMVLLIPLTMLGFGRLFMKRAPKDINFVFGYRTEMSMKNRETWEFAHNHCGKLWILIGLIMLPVSAGFMFLALGKGADTVGTLGGWLCMAQCAVLVFSIIPTERALKKNFDSSGNRKDDMQQR